MKILHVITSLRTGGAEKLMVDLLPALSGRGFDVELLLLDGTDTPFRRAVENTGIRVHDFGIGGSVYSPVRMLRLAPMMRGFDIVHTHNTAPQLFAALGSLATSKTRLVTTEHNTNNRRRSWKGYRMVDRWMYDRYDRIICISPKAEQNLRDYLGNITTPISTINNGIDLSAFSSAPASSAMDEIAPESRKVLMVAAFREQKDQAALIRAFTYLPPEFHLFLAGTGDRLPEARHLVAELGLENRVHFLGMRTDVAPLLHEADYVVMSSHYEGLSLSSIEGMSVGKPFLASSVDGLFEVVEGAGILFPESDSKAIASEILKLEANPELRTRVADDCRRRASEFDISVMANGYADIYNSLCAR